MLLVHYLSFYFVVNTSSSVTAGVNKACQSAGVFIFSDLAFCRMDSRECFTVYKGVSCGLVTFGTVFFAWASSRASFDAHQAHTNSDKKTSAFDSGASAVAASGAEADGSLQQPGHDNLQEKLLNKTVPLLSDHM